jgi:preprotein translocase subunit SecE
MNILFYFLSALLVAGGIAGFYYFADWPGLVRAALVVLGVVAAGGVLLLSEPGKAFVAFVRAAVAEVRKVVWPSRKETTQATLVVFAFVVTLAIFMWLVDKTLEWVLYGLLLGWK